MGEKSDWVQKAAIKWAAEPVHLDTIGIHGIQELVKNNTQKLRLINVWATWCVPCVHEFPDLVTLNRMYPNRGHEMISISLDDAASQPKALAFLQRNQSSSPNYIFAGNDKYHLIETLDPNWQGALPYSMLIEPGGKIVYTKKGMNQFEELKKIIFNDPFMGRIFK